MKGPWKALAFLAAVAGTALVLSTSAFALGGGAAPAPARWKTNLSGAAWSGRMTALYPGAANNIELKSITVTNPTGAKERLSAVTASIRTTGGDVQNAAGAEIHGCRASWFGVSVEHASRSLPAVVPPGDAYTAKIALTMRDSATNQDACRGAAPAFTVITTS
jgi:hypothetical protein